MLAQWSLRPSQRLATKLRSNVNRRESRSVAEGAGLTQDQEGEEVSGTTSRSVPLILCLKRPLRDEKRAESHIKVLSIRGRAGHTMATPLLTFTPSEKIVIDLASNETARTVVKCQNTSSTPVAFKVKTTAPKRYLVKPNQGVLAPGQVDRIQIQIVPKERQVLLSRSQQEDRFMVLSVACGDQLLRLEKDSEQYTSELTGLWGSVGSGAQQAKFSVSFTTPTDGGAAANDTNGATGSQGERLREMLSKTSKDKSASPSKPGSSTAGAATTTSSAGGATVPGQSEVLSMRKKYDELVSYTVNLTAERDRLKNEMENTKKELNKATLARLAAEKGEGGDGKRRGGGGTTTTTVGSKGGEGFSLLQLLLVALVCFFLGR